MKKLLKSLALVLIGGAIGYYLASTFVYSTGKVEGRSMEPTYHDGDDFIINHMQAWMRMPVRDEVVVIRLSDGDTVIKRVVGLPGDVWGGITLEEDEYWVLGDNSKLSDDSRNFGPVKRKQIIGVVE